MKINHHDSYHQIYDYYVDMKSKAIEDGISKNISEESKGVKGEDNVIIYYLTKNGKDAKPKSSNGIDYIQISFEEHILNWINECQKEVKNITNLNEAFENYKNIVKKITNKYEGNVMQLKDLLMKDNNLQLVINDIQPAIIQSKIEIQTIFWTELKEELRKYQFEFEFVNYNFSNLDFNNTIKNYYRKAKNNKNYGIKYDVKEIYNNYILSFYVELNWNIYYGFTIQENNTRKNIAKKEKFVELSDSILKLSSLKWESTNRDENQGWWICWKYPTKKLDFHSFNSENIFELVDIEKRKKYIKAIADDINLAISEYKDAL